ncbi:MAG TPA: MiaB/RimO family radical SAM methylthiotransferase [Candidatus Saccharimonadales bacterium]|nr:MiaB/RimO family radical SAM methylthiotransferase [Candidatus Saccharimonadales bacterium]
MQKPTFYIKTFGCQQNLADSQRISSYYVARGYHLAKSAKTADTFVINTCAIRQSAEDRVTGLVKNITKSRTKKPKIVMTGCMVGMAARDETGKYLKALKNRMPEVDEFLPLEEVGFDYPALRSDVVHSWVPISNGCNNFCTFCVVPFTRGREISRPFKDIIEEIKQLAQRGCKEVTLLGQNVNSYGSDLVKNANVAYKLPNGRVVKPVIVKHLGKYRIPTIFPYLLEEVCKIKGIEIVKFISSNPWDFSDKLISTIANNKKIDRNLHLAVQSGDDEVLKRMNRWYSSKDYLNLVKKIKTKIKGAQISTDIIVGFPGETEQQFQNTVKLAKTAKFAYAYVSKYSQRPVTAAAKAFKDDISHKEKDRRWVILNSLINQQGNLRTAVH